MRTRASVKSYAEIWKTAYSWLIDCGAKPSLHFCKEEITTHPDYPSLLSITDFLDAGGMDYRAVQANLSHIHAFNYPILVHTRQPGMERIHILSSNDAWSLQPQIAEYWTGVVVFPGPKAHWKHEGNSAYLQNERKDKLLAAGAALISVIAWCFSVWSLDSILVKTFGLLSLLGLLLGLITLGVELGFQNIIVRQVCSAVSDGGCAKVLKSRYVAGIGGITPADMAVLYFSAQYFTFLAACWWPHWLPTLLAGALTGVVIIAWSLYTQAFKIKQWCMLCLGIASILACQSAIAFFSPRLSINFSCCLFFLIGITTTALFLVFVKRLVMSNQVSRIKLAELKRWKLDRDLFLAQWTNEQQVDAQSWRDDIVLGNPGALVRIIVACNPYCGPCARAHKELDKILKLYGSKMAIEMRFLHHASNCNDRRNVAIRSILQRFSTCRSDEQRKEMLSDWFDWMDLDKWSRKWKPDSGIEVNQNMERHLGWITTHNITQTPTLFINGQKLPGRYSIADFGQLLPHVAEDLYVSE